MYRSPLGENECGSPWESTSVEAPLRSCPAGSPGPRDPRARQITAADDHPLLPWGAAGAVHFDHSPSPPPVLNTSQALSTSAKVTRTFRATNAGVGMQQSSTATSKP